MKEDFMSHSITKIKNKQQKHPKVQIKQYLRDSSEPIETDSHYLPPELQYEILEDRFSMRRRLKRFARRIREQ